MKMYQDLEEVTNEDVRGRPAMRKCRRQGTKTGKLVVCK